MNLVKSDLETEIKYYMALIENYKNPKYESTVKKLRFQATRELSKRIIKSHKKYYRFFENLLISDTNLKVRLEALKFLCSNFKIKKLKNPLSFVFNKDFLLMKELYDKRISMEIIKKISNIARELKDFFHSTILKHKTFFRGKEFEYLKHEEKDIVTLTKENDTFTIIRKRDFDEKFSSHNKTFFFQDLFKSNLSKHTFSFKPLNSELESHLILKKGIPYFYTIDHKKLNEIKEILRLVKDPLDRNLGRFLEMALVFELFPELQLFVGLMERKTRSQNNQMFLQSTEPLFKNQ